MNRSRTMQRNFTGEGSDRSQQLGIALAQIADPDLLESLLHHIAAIQQFGGEFYVGAARERFDAEGKASDAGNFETYAYVVAYNDKARVKALRSAGSEERSPEQLPELVVEPAPNGAEPEVAVAEE